MTPATNKEPAVMDNLVEQAEAAANALIALASGVTLEAVEKLPPVDPVTVAGLLEQLAAHMTTDAAALKARVEVLEGSLRECVELFDLIGPIMKSDQEIVERARAALVSSNHQGVGDGTPEGPSND